GTIATYSYTGVIDEDDFEKTVEDVTGKEVSVSGSQDLLTGENNFTVNFSEAIALDVEEQTAMNNAIDEAYPDNKIEVVTVSSVSPTMGFDFLLKCIVAVGFASVVMVIYVGLRFRKIGGMSAGVCALVALLHDLCMVYATFAIFRMPLDDNFMSIMLVILGYSVNDTIIIYDRVRENEQLYGNKLTPAEMVNLSTNQSLSRSLHTSATTIFSMVVVLIMALANGVDSIVTFTLPLIVGLISGTYSTLCIACPTWVGWLEHKAKKARKSA
ncbi:MAG TPA: protein translocase subunit SecF, partial [Candidatus Faecivivens stercoripullorum]|nr:protein translocase subunit SecF [Candidatus Faecivivens stercoripullorum]